MRRGLVAAALAALFLAVFALPSSAQVFTGRVDVTALDSTGAVLPGVTVELSGVQSASATTDTTGQAHFLNLAPGKYMVTAKLKGFGDYKNDNVPVAAGSTVNLRMGMAIGGVATSVNVKAETPLIEPKKETVSTTVNLDQLQNIPSSRDPWVVLQTVPSVIVDRVNVGGAESGQQSTYQAKGASGGDNSWNIDGISVTDMSALGSTSTYYDFDMFQEMNITTGGSDPALMTPGIALNMVLRSGTNAWRGSGRYYFENHSMQANNVPANFLGVIKGYNRIDSLKDYGAEGGGPLIKNRLFLQASAGETHPKLLIYTQCASITPPLPSTCTTAPAVTTQYGVSSHDATILQDYSAKATFEASKDARLEFTYFRGNKQKFGRGAGVNRPSETTDDQTGPTTMYKGQANLTLSNNAFVSVRYAHLTGGFSLTPEGGLTTPTYQDASATWHGSYYYYATNRPQDTLQADGNIFKGKNELKFGFAWKKASVTSDSGWGAPGGIVSSLYTLDGGGPICRDGTSNCAASAMVPSLFPVFLRDHKTNTSAVYMSGYLGDTINAGRLTFNLGVRWDRQAASLGAVSDPANPVEPGGLLPAVTGAAANNAIVWNSFVPRVGLTYALDKDHKTLLRASYAIFASQMGATAAAVLSTVQYSYTYYVNVPDLNGNHIADPNEAKLGTLAGTVGVTGTAPTLTTPNVIGAYKTPRTNEWLLGFDHQMAANFAIGGTFTYRLYDRFDWYHLTGVNGTAYTALGTYTCTAAQAAIVGSCSVGYFTKAAADPAGKTYEVRPNYFQTYWGIEINATKRMSNNWMARAAFTTGRTTENIGGSTSVLDPTPMATGNSSGKDLGVNQSGGDVSTRTSGSGKSNIFLVAPRYQFIANMSYQAKYGINIGVNYLLRQGYAKPYFTSAVGSGAKSGSNGLLLVDPTNYPHLPAVNSLDARIGKTVKLKNNANLNFDVDIFNLLNLDTVLGRQYDLKSTITGNQVLEIMNPRILRLGVRFSF
jgi:hypothetical protein